MNYILDEHGNPQAERDIIAWFNWFESSITQRIVARDTIDIVSVFGGTFDVRVSTVFLAVDYNFGEKGPPLLYETLVFGGELDEEMDRYSTRAQAVIGHAKMLERVKATAPAPAGG